MVTKKTPSDKNITESMNHLDLTMQEMLHIFRDAAESMKLEEVEESELKKRLTPIENKLNMLIDQNEKIAQGMVALADMFNEEIPEIKMKLSQLSIPRPTGPLPPPRIPKTNPSLEARKKQVFNAFK